MRAARVLKPQPGEAMTPEGGLHTDLESGLTPALVARMKRILFPASYEFFGTLTDEQIEEFLAKGEIRLPAKSLKPAQARALQRWLDAMRESLGSDEFLVTLYKMGAKEDFSNVDVGFGTKGHEVGVYLWLGLNDAGEGPIISNDFAHL